MAVSEVVIPPLIEYPVLFRGYVIKSAQYILARVRQAGEVLLPDERDLALQTLAFALKLPEAWPDTRELLLAMAPKMEQAGYRDKWLPYLEQGLDQSLAQGDVAAVAELQLQLGILSELHGNYNQAYQRLAASAASFEQQNDSLGRARALNRLAYVARRQRRFSQARQLVESALGLLAGQESEQAFSYLVLGAVALDTGQWPEAVAQFRQALALWEQEVNQRMIARTGLGLGAALRNLGQYEEAIAIYKQAIAIFEAVEDPVHRAVAQMNLGNVYLSLEQPEQALASYRPAKRLFRQTQDRLWLGHIHYNSGLAYHGLQQWAEAREAYLAAIKHYQETGNVALLVEALDQLGLLYLDQGQPAEARATFEEALNQLAQIKGQPGYEQLLEKVREQLQRL